MKRVRVKLAEVFKDFKIVLKSMDEYRKRLRVREWARVEYPLNPEGDFGKGQKIGNAMVSYAAELRKRYPDRGYRLTGAEVNGKLYIVLRKAPHHKRDVPIYVDLDEGRFFVPQYYLKRRRKLTMYTIMATLGELTRKLRDQKLGELIRKLGDSRPDVEVRK